MFNPITYELAKKYTDDKLENLWNDAEVLDFTKTFDYVESVMQGGALVEKTIDFEGHGLGEYVVSLMQKGPVKIKVGFNGLVAESVQHAQNFGNYCQFTDLVVYDGHLLYLYLYVNKDSTLIFQCKEITTAPFNPS